MNWLTKITIGQMVSPEDTLISMCRGNMSVQEAANTLNAIPNNVVCETASALMITWSGAFRELNEIIRLFGCNGEVPYANEVENNNIDTSVSDFE